MHVFELDAKNKTSLHSSPNVTFAVFVVDWHLPSLTPYTRHLTPVLISPPARWPQRGETRETQFLVLHADGLNTSGAGPDRGTKKDRG